MTDKDQCREHTIKTLLRAMLHTQSAVTRRALYDRFREEIMARSPEQISKMERERGLIRG